jgi:hypothetical protein
VTLFLAHSARGSNGHQPCTEDFWHANALLSEYFCRVGSVAFWGAVIFGFACIICMQTWICFWQLWKGEGGSLTLIHICASKCAIGAGAAVGRSAGGGHMIYGTQGSATPSPYSWIGAHIRSRTCACILEPSACRPTLSKLDNWVASPTIHVSILSVAIWIHRNENISS